MHYPFIVNTEASLIAPDLSMYINVTTINPIFVICGIGLTLKVSFK